MRRRVPRAEARVLLLSLVYTLILTALYGVIYWIPTVVRAFGVTYGYVRPPEGGDLYVTRYGWPQTRSWCPYPWNPCRLSWSSFYDAICLTQRLRVELPRPCQSVERWQPGRSK